MFNLDVVKVLPILCIIDKQTMKYKHISLQYE